ncbi:hypothetical protein LTR62_008062 [Meristemomyces frigidus]|uniref:Uncharacterized protein n=1 Tax=Meristemomyces frigidus TaxID=1508187 RepID=A0AAN7YJ28_9PEZI|nr:hypothetical protein LTR62_008062 [Meristemomyces frigidus]
MSRSDFVDCVEPVHERIELYDASRLPTDQPKNDAVDQVKALPQAFIDAMIVREEVYVKEQGILLENELDNDDARSYHWVVYASIPGKVQSPEIVAQGTNGKTAARRSGTSTKVPIGTIRLVPPPHAPHSSEHSKPNSEDKSDHRPDSPLVYDPKKESYVKLGRLAVIKEFRKAGISKLLIETALSFARANHDIFAPNHDPARFEAEQQLSDRHRVHDWKGLVLVHSQVGVQKVWRKYGFETDASMGEWDEEGIMHVGMWRRLDVGRRKSRVFLGTLGSPIASP